MKSACGGKFLSSVKGACNINQIPNTKCLCLYLCILRHLCDTKYFGSACAKIVKLSFFLPLSIYLSFSQSLHFSTNTHQRKLFKDLKDDLHSSVIHYWNCLLKLILFLHWKHVVNWGQYSSPLSLSAKWIRNVYLVEDLVRQSLLSPLSSIFWPKLLIYDWKFWCPFTCDIGMHGI